MTRYIDRNWHKWEANIEPILIAAEEEERRRMKRLNSEINMMTEDSFEELKLPENDTFSPVKAKEEMTPEQVLEDTDQGVEEQNQPPISTFNYQQQQDDIQQLDLQIEAQPPSYYQQFLRGKFTDESGGPPIQHEVEAYQFQPKDVDDENYQDLSPGDRN